MLTYSKKDSYIIPVTASFIGLSVKLRLPHTSHLTPHTSHLTPHTSHLTTTAGLDRKRLLMWIIAWCGLSAAW
nr:aminoglycoside phosphotransferase family protein [Escherichia coli]